LNGPGHPPTDKNAALGIERDAGNVKKCAGGERECRDDDRAYDELSV
jgi:hypothetical protein